MKSPEAREYERLDRHIRTANSVRELLIWDAGRAMAALPATHDKALTQAVAARMKHLTGRKP